MEQSIWGKNYIKYSAESEILDKKQDEQNKEERKIILQKLKSSLPSLFEKIISLHSSLPTRQELEKMEKQRNLINNFISNLENIAVNETIKSFLQEKTSPEN